MAALYLHNAIFSPEPPESEGHSLHGRHLSTLSTGTLRTNTTDHSHPTEPLLDSATSVSSAYRDLLDRQPVHPDGPRPGWDLGLSLEAEAPTSTERKRFWEKRIKRRLRRLKAAKVLLEAVIGLWATYNLVRYFIAYTRHRSRDGQTVSLVLATSATLSLAFLLAAALVSAFRSHLLSQHIPLRTLLLMQTVLHYLSSFFLLAPAIVNFAFVFIWRNSSDPELTLQQRCNLDIDVTWSVSRTWCSTTAWGAWLALSVVRAILTFGIIATFHLTSSTYQRTRRPSQSGDRVRARRTRHANTPSDSSFYRTSPITATSTLTRLSPSALTPAARPSGSPRSSERNSPHSTRTLLRRPSGPGSPGSSSSESITGPSPAYTTSGTESDRELNHFARTFRAIVTQISRETEQAVDLARGPSPDPYTLASLSPDASPDRTPTYDRHTYLGYDEFGLPYRPEEDVHMLGRQVRRMPTIESVGSREAWSTVSGGGRPRRSESVSTTAALSRPPTRTNTLSMSDGGSAPPSRANSLGAASSLVGARLGAGEMGERIGGHEHGTGGTQASASRSSYYTATGSEDGMPSPGVDGHFPGGMPSPGVDGHFPIGERD